MQKHGNLYWDIQFSIGATKDAGFCERTHITVCGYDYKDTFERAQKLYNLAHKKGMAVCYFSMMLRFDDLDDDAFLHFNICKTWCLADDNDPGAFFCGVPEVSMKGLLCTK